MPRCHAHTLGSTSGLAIPVRSGREKKSSRTLVDAACTASNECMQCTLRNVPEIADVGMDSDREVDVALINGADPLFLKRITEQCRLLYGSPRALHELRMDAFKRYQDQRRFLAMKRVALRSSLLA